MKVEIVMMTSMHTYQSRFNKCIKMKLKEIPPILKNDCAVLRQLHFGNFISATLFRQTPHNDTGHTSIMHETFAGRQRLQLQFIGKISIDTKVWNLACNLGTRCISPHKCNDPPTGIIDFKHSMHCRHCEN